MAKSSMEFSGLDRAISGLVAVMTLLVIASPSRAMVGPPEIMPDRTVRAEFFANSRNRDIEFTGRSGATTFIPVGLTMEQDAFAARISYAVTSDFSIRGLLGLSRMKLGNPIFGNLGALNMQGDFGQTFGIGAQYNLAPGQFSPDIRLAASVDWRNEKSAIPGGDIEADELQFAIKGGKEMAEFFPYAGVLWSPFEADFKGITGAGIGTSGHLVQNDRIGLFVGTTYRISDRLTARMEGEFVTSRSLTLGLAYDLVGYWSTGADPTPPPPVSPAERAAAVPPPVIPDRGVIAEPEVEVSRSDVRKANEEVERGNSLAAQGRTGEAASAYEIALELDPGNYRAKYNLATLRYKEKNFGESRRLYAELLKVTPSDVEANLFLGFSHYRMGDLEGAARAWRHVLEIDPANSVALNNLQALQR